MASGCAAQFLSPTNRNTNNSCDTVHQQSRLCWSIHDAVPIVPTCPLPLSILVYRVPGCFTHLRVCSGASFLMAGLPEYIRIPLIPFIYFPTMALHLFNKLLLGRQIHRGSHYGFPPTGEPPVPLEEPLRPLPPGRPRRLTNTTGSHDQKQSYLIARIPPEVRIIIWGYVVGRRNDRDVLHLDLGDGTVRYNRCWEQDHEDKLVFKHLCWTAPWLKEDRDLGRRGRREPFQHLRSIRPLLFTCKLMCASLFCTPLTIA